MTIENQHEFLPKEITHPKITRRVFLTTIATIAAALIAKKLFKEKPPQIPESEKLDSAPLRSPYFWAALNEMKKKHPEQVDTVRGILEKTDQQGVDNLAIFHPHNDPNLSFPYTKVSVNEITARKGVDQDSSAPKPKLIYMIFTGFAYPPAGHPFTPWDIVYDRVINSIPSTFVWDKDVEVYSVGYPQGLGGKVTEQWVKAVEDGVEPYGKLYGEFIDTVLAANDPDTKAILQGMSFSSSLLGLAFSNLTKEQQSRVRLLLDNPVADHGPVDIKELQIPLAFAAETSFRSIYDPRIESAIEAEQIFFGKYQQVLTQKGIDWQDNKQQASLKKEVARADLLHMMKGVPMDTENIRAFIRRGIIDPLSFPSKGFIKSLDKEGRNNVIATSKGKTLEFAIGATHWINRYRVDKWSRVLRNYPQTKAA